MTASLTSLSDELQRRGLLASPAIEDSFVYGPARFEPIGGDVMVNVDPEVEDRGTLDVSALTDRVERFLALTPPAWQTVIKRTASEIEDAVGDEPGAEQIDLRDDLALKSVVVFVDVVLLSFDAPRQFPDSVIRVLLDEDLAFDDVEIDERDNDDETMTFGSLDELLDHLSAAGPEGVNATEGQASPDAAKHDHSAGDGHDPSA
ncbi:hypothetical protein [Leifsonia aquatica]|uniref:hypothetical protein n=1 Tax=Leifsonia aquatica TaxID=144185 RepID=UPI00046ADF95|nr:hypothetical protein [Leifsonia aquatica]